MDQKKVGIIIVILIAVFAIAFYSTDIFNDLFSKKPQQLDLSGELHIISFDSVLPIVEEKSILFMEKYPDVKITISEEKEDFSLNSFIESNNNILVIGRELSEQDKDQNPNLEIYEIGKQAIAIIVNPSLQSRGPINSISMENLQLMFSGGYEGPQTMGKKELNWRWIGGFDRELILLSLMNNSDTRMFFENIILKPIGEEITNKTISLISEKEIRDYVAKEVASMGYISISYVNQSVTIINIDDIEPTKENINSGDYPIIEPVTLILKKPPNDLETIFISDLKSYFDD
jgi:phosphate transport system substrate-binding protein